MKPDLVKILWDYHCVDDVLRKVDVIIGLGSYDLRVASYCAELFNQGYASKIIFTGKEGNWTAGNIQKTEAQLFCDEAVKCGVPRGSILLEESATNIGENLLFSRSLFGFGIKSAIVVTKPNTTRRVLATAGKVWPELDLVLSSPRVGMEDLAAGRSFKDLVNEMVGDLQRMKVYAEKGFQVAQEVPGEVWEAFEGLVEAGFDGHLVY